MVVKILQPEHDMRLPIQPVLLFTAPTNPENKKIRLLRGNVKTVFSFLNIGRDLALKSKLAGPRYYGWQIQCRGLYHRAVTV